MSGGDTSGPAPPPGIWCTRCGARPGIAGPAWICRVCVAGGPHKRIVMNPGRRPLPPGTPRARDRYRAAGLCVQCGRRRDLVNRLSCERCRQIQNAAQDRYRSKHPRGEAHLEDVRQRRRRYIAAGRCPECGGERDRPDRKLCARCRRLAADNQRAHRERRRAVGRRGFGSSVGRVSRSSCFDSKSGTGGYS